MMAILLRKKAMQSQSRKAMDSFKGESEILGIMACMSRANMKMIVPKAKGRSFGKIWGVNGVENLKVQSFLGVGLLEIGDGRKIEVELPEEWWDA